MMKEHINGPNRQNVLMKENTRRLHTKIWTAKSRNDQIRIQIIGNRKLSKKKIDDNFEFVARIFI